MYHAADTGNILQSRDGKPCLSESRSARALSEALPSSPAVNLCVTFTTKVHFIAYWVEKGSIHEHVVERVGGDRILPV